MRVQVTRGPVLVRRTIPPSALRWPQWQTDIYRLVLGFAAASIVSGLVIVRLFHYSAIQRSDRPSRPEIASLDGSASPAEIAKPSAFDSSIGATRITIKGSLKAPVKRGVTGLHFPISVPNATVGGTKEIDVPAPDIASGSSGERYPLDKSLSDLPLAGPTPPPPAILAPSSGKISADAEAVIAALERYSNAWNAKRVAQITALRPGLPRRTVEEELSSASSIRMHIQPTSAPRIEGNRATVECIHQVDQVFKDGIEKQSPGVKMTYVLVKRGNNWLIEASR
jgi:hypothetical protein